MFVRHLSVGHPPIAAVTVYSTRSNVYKIMYTYSLMYNSLIQVSQYDNYYNDDEDD